jgi:type I restriction-modification system DNA methylase subunit
VSATIETFKLNLKALIANFEQDKSYYLAKGYLEAQARVDFITPFFEALGWDVGNKAGLRHDQREVIVEKGESETTGRPDYSFRIAGQTKFFVEAKAASEDLRIAKHVLQAKRYAWNTRQVFFVVLANFAEFRFYDASIKPDERTSDEGLLLSFSYTDYLKNAENLWEFSKERVMAGSLDAMLPRDRRAERLRIPVDQAFLEEMTGWREDLARNTYKNNPDFTAKQLNEVVQRLLDRIVFIRIAEDRRIIERYQLRAAAEEWEARGGKFDIFDWLRPLFEKINNDFNGEIFKPNDLLENTRVDSGILARIIQRLYPPKSPYRFDVIGVELLGSIYERYLGNTIRVTPKQVRVEEKPEVRHAGGVYYTPKYIVDYIVKEAVGKIIEGKTPKQIENIRILDPACGSGSFLMGAFQYLIDYHVRYLSEHPKEARVHPLFPDLIRDEGGESRLSVMRKARILRNNLYGVDIDPQAVEITMMSLYLKALEGEKSQLPPKHSLLPELKYNILCGNSLIGPDDYEQLSFFQDKNGDRINPFDWQAGFPEIMKAGGFDAVIGNPPYIRVQTLQQWAPFEVEFYKQHYAAASSGNYDIYVVFVEKGLSLLKKTGALGFILPHKFFNARYGESLRGLIANGNHLSHVVHFGDQQVFEGATNYTCLLFLAKAGCKGFEFEKVDHLDRWRTSGLSVKGLIGARSVTAADWNFNVGDGGSLFRRLSTMSVSLGDLAERIAQGIRTSANEVYVLDRVSAGSRLLIAHSEQLGQDVRIEAAAVSPFLQGREIKAYGITPPHKVVIIPYSSESGRTTLIDEDVLKRKFPKAYSYLLANKTYLSRREHGRMRGPAWYGYIYPKNLEVMTSPKILVPDIADRASFAFDEKGEYAFTSGYGITLREDARESPKYVLGLLNSKLLDWYLKRISTPLRGGFFRYFTQFLEKLPIRTIRFSETADEGHHDHIVKLVDRMLELNSKKRSGRLAPSELDSVERDIATTGAKIDELVYELYGITKAEREMIESA